MSLSSYRMHRIYLAATMNYGLGSNDPFLNNYGSKDPFLAGYSSKDPFLTGYGSNEPFLNG